MINTIREIRNAVSEHRHNKYISYKEAFKNWYSSRNSNYEIYTLNSVRKFKTADTIFILGNGPSLNLLSSDHIKEIDSHNSFGISYSYLKDEIIPTFHVPAMENNKYANLKLRRDMFSNYREKYREVVMFISTKALLRMAHPRVTPYFFPEDAKCCIFRQPEAIRLEKKRPFKDEDFDKSLLYRGSLSCVLHLALKLDYKKIVLLGVDLDKWSYFYENMEKMAWYVKKTHNEAYGVEHIKEKEKRYTLMYTNQSKPHPLDEYLYALKDYLKRKKDVNLFIGFKDNILYPKIPAYFG